MEYAGRPQEAITLAKKAIRLSPYYSAWYLGILGVSYCMAGNYNEALAVYKKLLERSRKGEIPPLWAHFGLAEVYIELGREKEARDHAKKAIRIDPNYSLEVWKNSHFYKDPAHLERRLDALRKAGMK